MEINYSQPNGTCINEISIYGYDDETVNLIDSISGYKNIQIVHLNLTEAAIILISDTPEIELLEKLSREYQLPMNSTFYNSEANYAGRCLISAGRCSLEIDTYYKGLYYNYPAKFWEEIDNLIFMMSESGGDWNEIHSEIADYCQEYDYNDIKEKFLNLVRIT